jgi:hypothetical protein
MKANKINYNEWVQRYIDSVDGKSHQSAIEIITELSTLIDDLWNILNISPNDDITDIQRLVRIGDILEGVIDEDGKPFYRKEQIEEEIE